VPIYPLSADYRRAKSLFQQIASARCGPRIRCGKTGGCVRYGRRLYPRPVRIPRALETGCRSDPGWLSDLPDLAAECAQQWELVLESPFDSGLSLVVPAGDVVLRLNASAHFEAEHEADALQRWAAGGALRLIARDDSRRALLVERCRPGTRRPPTGLASIALDRHIPPGFRASGQ
jgi:hypothetical protein